MTAVEKETPRGWDAVGNRRGALVARLSSAAGNLATERQLLPNAVEARLATLLTEIDEIILPRLLRLHLGAQEVACLTVSHRRLISISPSGRPAASQDAKDLLNQCASRLVEIAHTSGQLSLTVGRRATPPAHAETACSVAALSQALTLATPQNAFDRLRGLVAPKAVAQLLWSDTNPAGRVSGATEWAVLMQVFVENYRASGGYRRADTCVGPSRAEGLLIPLTADQVLIVASLEQSGFVAILARADGLKAITAWQSH